MKQLQAAVDANGLVAGAVDQQGRSGHLAGQAAHLAAEAIELMHAMQWSSVVIDGGQLRRYRSALIFFGKTQ